MTPEERDREQRKLLWIVTPFLLMLLLAFPWKPCGVRKINLIQMAMLAAGPRAAHPCPNQ